MVYYIDFFTIQSTGTGSLKLGCVNTFNSTNRYSVTYRAITDLSSSTSSVNSGLPFASPNPIQGVVRIINNDNISSSKEFDGYGRLIKSMVGAFEFVASSLTQ